MIRTSGCSTLPPAHSRFLPLTFEQKGVQVKKVPIFNLKNEPQNVPLYPSNHKTTSSTQSHIPNLNFSPTPVYLVSIVF